MKKLAVVTTHPIQYYAPLFKLLSFRQNIKLKVFYTWGELAKGEVFDHGFGKARQWDVPLLEGYEYEFVKNISASPGSGHFRGIINPDIIDRLKDYGADAVFVFGWAFQSHLKVMRYFKNKIPVYFRGDSTLLDEPKGFSLKKLARRFFLTWVYRHIDYAFYVGTNNMNYFAAHGVNASQLIYAPHAIDNYRFQDNELVHENQAKEWRNALGIPSNVTIVLFAGKLDQNKKAMQLVKAAKVIPAMHFIIIGNGAMEEEIKQASHGLSNVTMLPFQNQLIMPVVYRLADIFALLSASETWGLAINEAMASGLAIIASKKCGGAADLIENGINGFVINADLNDFTRVLQLLNNDISKVDSFKNSSLKKIKNFTYTAVAEAIEKAVKIL